mmetsp:Transcript_23523/g.53663  ORF Transcript_23523/g.53663 Transcript_23523/m.53663 type:complete len:450 (-) Transcript_23523:651-2000(-)
MLRLRTAGASGRRVSNIVHRGSFGTLQLPSLFSDDGASDGERRRRAPSFSHIFVPTHLANLRNSYPDGHGVSSAGHATTARRYYSTTRPVLRPSTAPGSPSSETFSDPVDAAFSELEAPKLPAEMESLVDSEAHVNFASIVTGSSSEEIIADSATVPLELVLDMWHPHHGIMKLVMSLAEYCDIPIAVSILAITLSLRSALLPLTIRAMRNSSRLAHMQPELEQLTTRMNADPKTKTNPVAQKNYQAQIRALFAKYDCNPLKSMVVPLVQMPIFMSMFFGLRKLPEFFPDQAITGGVLWFTDLTLSDPLYIMPFITSATFLLMVEIGADGMNAAAQTQQQKTMKNMMRGLGVLMFPMTAHFPAALFCYWVPNNAVSLAQTLLLKRSPVLKKKLGIWDPPKLPPGAPEPKGIMNQIKEVRLSDRSLVITHMQNEHLHSIQCTVSFPRKLN